MAEVSQIILNEAGLRNLLTRPVGPVGQYVARRGQRVGQRARTNASGGGPGPRVRTGDLLRDTGTRQIEFVNGELQSVVESAARHGGFNYPVAQELGGVTPGGHSYRFPFLEPALAEEFGQAYRG